MKPPLNPHFDNEARPPKPPLRHPAVDQMIALMRGDPSLSGKQLSPILGLSVSRLARLFKRQVGMSIVEYRNQARFERFFALLTETGGRPTTLRLAARMAGFGSYAHFHRLCRKRWNRGPRESIRLVGIRALAAASVPTGTRVHEVVVHTGSAPDSTFSVRERHTQEVIEPDGGCRIDVPTGDVVLKREIR